MITESFGELALAGLFFMSSAIVGMAVYVCAATRCRRVLLRYDYWLVGSLALLIGSGLWLGSPFVEENRGPLPDLAMVVTGGACVLASVICIFSYVCVRNWARHYHPENVALLGNRVGQIREDRNVAADDAIVRSDDAHSGGPGHPLPAFPNDFLCPISRAVMADPVQAADGHSYDRTYIEEWLRHNNTSPITNKPLPNVALVPNYNLRGVIDDYFARNPRVADPRRGAAQSSAGHAV